MRQTLGNIFNKKLAVYEKNNMILINSLLFTNNWSIAIELFRKKTTKKHSRTLKEKFHSIGILNDACFLFTYM